MKKFLIWSAIAFFAFYAAFFPNPASEGASIVLGGILKAANGIADFFTNLVT